MPSVSTEAKSEVDEAQRLFDQNDMKGALPKYQRAYELSHDRTVLLRIAACWKNLGMFTRAREAAERYLDTAVSVLRTGIAEAQKYLGTPAPPPLPE